MDVQKKRKEAAAADVRALDVPDGGEDERERLVASPLAAAERRRTRLWLVSSLGGVAALFLVLVYMVVHGAQPPTGDGNGDEAETGVAALRLVRALPADVAARMDAATDPCADFYAFSCGRWVRETEIPADRTGVYLSFTTVQDENERALKEILSDDYWPYVGELFGSCMDMQAINATGAAPLADGLRKIAQTNTTEQLFRLAGELSQAGPSFLTGLGVYADDRDATKYALYASQSGLSLPDPEYYLDDDKFNTVADDFRTFVTTLFTLVGWDAADAQENADMIIAFEKELAAIFVPKEELKDPTSTYNLVVVADAIKSYPLLMGQYLNGTGITGKLANGTASSSMIIETPAFFAAAEQLVTNSSTSVESLQVLLTYHYVRSFASQLSDPFIDATFAFYGQTLSGQKQRRERWKVCLSRVTGNLPDLIGKYFALKRFDRESGELANQLVGQIEAVMAEKLHKLDWLDSETRQQALWKLSNVTNLIGHASSMDAWTNHYPFVLTPGNYSKNLEILSKFEFDRAVNRIGQTVDRSQWFMSAAEVNAYYAPSSNQIVFPAGILQPPFFDRRNHPARNFGAIGSVIGHELTHGFDDTGRFYAGDGNLRNWWSNSTSKEFRSRATCLVDQYDGFVTTSASNDSTTLGNVNGNYTLGENIADNGGLKLSFRAFKQFMATNVGGNDDSTDNVDSDDDDSNDSPMALSSKNADKLFFVSFAQAFCAKASDASMIQRLAVDPHSPEKWRVNGAVMNSADFANAFACPAGSPMNPRDKCLLW